MPKNLKQCLDSIINQTLKDIEIICLNDSSTDNGSEIIKNYRVKIPELNRNVITINSGYGIARKFVLLF